MKASREPGTFTLPWRPWWPRVAGFAVFLFAIMLIAGSKGTLAIGDIFIAVGFVVVLGAFAWWAMTFVRRRVKVVFDGWLMTVTPAIGKPRTVDVREIDKIRLGAQHGTFFYQCERKGESFLKAIRVPLETVPDQGAARGLLARLAVVDGVDADRKTTEDLAQWRAWIRATGTDPTTVPAPYSAEEPLIPAPYGA